MHILAFDIEAANGYKPSSICSIGIVVADEHFNVIHRENVWINPKTKYNLNGTRKNVGINLHLDKALLDASPDFSQVYGKIRELLTNESCVVIGHAVDADVRMLNAACALYKLPSINFNFVCSQLLYRLYKGEKEVKALNKIAGELGISYNEHNSEDDAWMSLMTLKYLTEQTGLSVQQLLEKYRIRVGNNNNFEITRCVTLDGQVSKRKCTQQALANLKAFASGIAVTSHEWENKVFCIARSLELEQSDTTKSILQAIVSRGGRYSCRLQKCNCYVLAEQPTEQDVNREKRVLELQQQGVVELYTPQDILTFRGNNMTTVQKFLSKHNQSSLNIDVEQLTQAFLQEMKNGLEGKPSSMPMIPTYLQNVDRSKIKPGKRLLIDAGGTNFRSAMGHFDEDGKVVLQHIRKTIMPASDGSTMTKVEFYNKIADNIAYLAEECGDIGFCFSYQVDMDKDIDGTLVMFSKEVRAPEAIGTRVGYETLQALGKHCNKPRKIAILNDTVATLLGGMASTDEQFSAYLGYIYGTGTNLCYVENTKNITKVEGLEAGEMLINMECGNFDKFVQGDFDKIVANNTTMPTKQLFEKATSGRYLADIIKCAFQSALEEGLFEGEVTLGDFILKDISDFLAGDENIVYNMFDCQNDHQTAREICEDLIERAAKMGATINAAAAVASCKDKSLPVAIVAEGTTFNRLTGYRRAFKKHLSEILSAQGVSFKIVQGEELNLVGTLMATMAL